MEEYKECTSIEIKGKGMPKKKEMTFKEAFAKMEEISLQLESADLDVEEGMKLVKEAEKLHKLLKQKLQSAKLVVKEK